ncbi:unnamed protein product [Caenorhabditis angaria]|uniref:BACK domain-containing protein n=1 Tax=Caenorhabditis angaria TaxID=860376 RepID=A0A9P1IXU1_9PELO|nr:unnamed protein product [Caenorhabditis angaria]
MGGNVSSETPTTSTKSKLVSLHSTLKCSFKRKRSKRDHTKPFRELIRTWPIIDAEKLLTEFDADLFILKLQKESDKSRKITKNFGNDYNSYRNERSDFVLILKNGAEISNLQREFVFSRCKKLRYSKLPSNFDQFSVEDIERFMEYVYTEKWNYDNETLEKLRKEFGCSKSLLEDNIEKEKHDYIKGDLIIKIVSEEVSKHEFIIKCDSFIASSRIFIHFLYTDILDLSLIPSSEVTISSLSEARAIISGKSPDIQLHRALQMMQVAKFFKVDRLVQSCEDVVVKHLKIDNCVAVLQWARDGGSKYIELHALRLIESEFPKICNSANLFDLTIEELMDVTSSQFLQSTELEILDSIIRWGEHDLLRKLEEREPNIVADTCHSISRRGLRRAELSGDELKDILKPLTMNIRIDYALPPFHNTLTEAYNRGILERSPLKEDLISCNSTLEYNPDVHWFKPSKNQAGPRYYKPYHLTLQKYIQQISDQQQLSNNPASCSDSIQSSPKQQTIVFENLFPEILDNHDFELAKERINEEWNNIQELPRLFHKLMALEIIKKRILTELDISEECFKCVFVLENDLETLKTEEKHEDEDLSNTSSSHSIAPDLLQVS